MHVRTDSNVFRKCNLAFTLVELLVVVGIMAMVVSFVAPAVTGIFRGSQLTQAGQIVSEQLGQARQAAITQNRTVQVRFYKFGDPGTPGQNSKASSTWAFQAMQSFVISDGGTIVPLGKVALLPQGIIIDGNVALSSVLGSGRPYITTQTIPVPRVGTSYAYYPVNFHPNGSTDLSTTINGANQLWFLTLHSAVYGVNLATQPINFWTIQIDPINGLLAGYHP